MGRKQEVIRFVDGKLYSLRELSGSGEGKALLANLRRGVGRQPGEVPELFGLLLSGMPEEFFSKGEEPTREEWACYIALTLYAMHQQGNDVVSSPVHIQEHRSLGKAMAVYAAQSDDSNAAGRMAQKLRALSGAKDMREFAQHLKAIIQLLKSKGITLNYAQLAGDIYAFQFTEGRTGVILKWGQDFYRKEPKEKKEDAENA